MIYNNPKCLKNIAHKNRVFDHFEYVLRVPSGLVHSFIDHFPTKRDEWKILVRPKSLGLIVNAEDSGGEYKMFARLVMMLTFARQAGVTRAWNMDEGHEDVT